MKLRHLTILTLIFSTSAFAQVLNNTFVEGSAVIVGQKTKAGASFTFSQGMGIVPFCYLPFKENKGALEIPKDKNGNLLPVNCKNVSEESKVIDINLKDQYESKKYDGVMLFSQEQLATVQHCLQDKEALSYATGGWGFDFNDYNHNDPEEAKKMEEDMKKGAFDQNKQLCTSMLDRVHVLALKKKRKLNKSTKELFTKHIDNSGRIDQQKSNLWSPYAPYSPMNSGFNMSIGTGGFGY